MDTELARFAMLAPMGYAVGLHIRAASASFIFRTYPQDWVEQYVEKGYMLCDPIVSWGFSTTGVCRWSELEFPDPHGVLSQAADFGLTYGAIVSFGPVNSRSMGGFARGDREFTDEELIQLKKSIALLHIKSEPPKSLTQAQADALRLIADGSRYAAAAELLGISESALKQRLKSTRERLSARTTVEAVQRAMEYKLL